MSKAQGKQYKLKIYENGKCFWLTAHILAKKQRGKDKDWIWPNYFNHSRQQNIFNKANHSVVRLSVFTADFADFARRKP